MLRVLETPAIRERAVPISVKTYHAMAAQGLVAERTELIRGVIVEKMSKSSLHCILNDELHERFKAALTDFWVRAEAPLTLADSEPEPDISIVPGTRWDYRDGHPTTAVLVVEVAVSSTEIDREKGALYAEAGVPEYWLVLADERAVEVHTAPEGTRYTSVRRIGPGETIQSTALSQIAVPFDALFPAV